jgi:hypothetical protein
MIKSWAMLEWYLPPESEKFPAFQHVGTQLRDDGTESGHRAGDAVWVAPQEQGCAGLAWEWTEVKPGIVMLTDPNSIVTNLQFVDDGGMPVLGLMRTIAINRLVHALPWQAAARAALQLQQARPGPAAVAQATQPTPHPLSHPLAAGDFRMMGNSIEPSVPAAWPLLRDTSAPGSHAAPGCAGRSSSRASDSEAGIDSLLSPHKLRRAA